MPDTSTEVAIATTTLGTSAANITFSSIPNTYTDLRLVIVVQETASGSGLGENLLVRVNNTLPDQSQTTLSSNGTTASSARKTSQLYGYIKIPFTGSNWGLVTLDFFNYASSINKTYLSTTSADLNGSGELLRGVHLIQTTNAITSIRIEANANSFAAGTTATLYGIL